MPRRPRGDTLAATPESSAPALSREVRLAELLAKLARRAGTWGWLTTYERIRRGEVVPRWYANMTRLTAAKRCGELRPPEGINDD